MFTWLFSSFKNYKSYPYATCISVNDAVVHGFPTNLPLKEGDVVLWRNKYWLVKDISESHEIERGRVRLSDYTIKLGCYFSKIPITKTNVPNNN